VVPPIIRAEYLRHLKGGIRLMFTEDCELGMRLSKEGFSTAIIDSTTLEEANSNIKNGIGSAPAWEKGYIQTTLST